VALAVKLILALLPISSEREMSILNNEGRQVMNVSQASKIWREYHRAHSKHNTIRAYEFTIAKFNQNFVSLNLNEVSTDDILDFMTKFTEGLKPQTKRIRFSHLTAFFNFMRINFDCDFKNPCDSPMLRKHSERKQMFIGILLKKRPSMKLFSGPTMFETG
jgi:hypothetical protein